MRQFKAYPQKSITASTTSRFTHADVLEVLNRYGIDTTTYKYQLEVETDQIYDGTDSYVKRFTCAGDYLAYFSMKLHKSPTVSNLSDLFSGSIQAFENFVILNPTVEDIAYEAEASWAGFGDGSESVVSLKNVSTGSVLYNDCCEF